MSARRNRNHITCSNNRNRRITLSRGPVAELPIIIIAPSYHGSVVLSSHAVILARCNRHHICHSTSLHGRQPLSRRPVTELAIGIVTPSPDGPIRL